MMSKYGINSWQLALPQRRDKQHYHVGNEYNEQSVISNG